MKKLTNISRTTVKQAMAYDYTRGFRKEWILQKNGHYRVYIKRWEPYFYKTTAYGFVLEKKSSKIYGCYNYHLTYAYPSDRLIMNDGDTNVCRIDLSKKEYDALLKWSEHGNAKTASIFHDLMSIGTRACKGMWLNRYDEVLAFVYDERLGRSYAALAMHDLGLNVSIIGRLDSCNNLEKLEITSVNADYKEK